MACFTLQHITSRGPGAMKYASPSFQATSTASSSSPQAPRSTKSPLNTNKLLPSSGIPVAASLQACAMSRIEWHWAGGAQPSLSITEASGETGEGQKRSTISQRTDDVVELAVSVSNYVHNRIRGWHHLSESEMPLSTCTRSSSAYTYRHRAHPTTLNHVL